MREEWKVRCGSSGPWMGRRKKKKKRISREKVKMDRNTQLNLINKLK